METPKVEIQLNTMVAQVRDALGIGAGGLVPGEAGAPCLELFHGANSICSQKVRTVLAHHTLPHVAHSVNMFAGQTYLPAYVRLRLRGCAAVSDILASTHDGSTSASTSGCDAAVVPTLVDWDQNEVIVDSKRICLYLDRLVPDTAKLRPAALADDIDRELAIVDHLPNYQMLMGKAPSADAARGGGDGSGFSMKKVERCDRYLAEYAGDEALVRAYTAKRAKELEAAQTLFSTGAMGQAYDIAEAACAGLEAKLRQRGSPWLFGTATTMADLFWMVELLRMKNVGANTFWDKNRLPHVARFVATAEALPSIRHAILDWPGALF